MGVSHINICISTAPSNFATRIGIGKFEPGRAVGSSSIVLMPVSPAYFELMTPKAPTKHLIHVESRRPWLPAGDVGAPTQGSLPPWRGRGEFAPINQQIIAFEFRANENFVI